jgi:hypothetical protein
VLTTNEPAAAGVSQAIGDQSGEMYGNSKLSANMLSGGSSPEAARAHSAVAAIHGWIRGMNAIYHSVRPMTRRFPAEWGACARSAPGWLRALILCEENVGKGKIEKNQKTGVRVQFLSEATVRLEKCTLTLFSLIPSYANDQCASRLFLLPSA